MAKKRARQTNKTKNIVSLRGTDEYKAWLVSVARATGLPLAATYHVAMMAQARKVGCPPPPVRIEDEPKPKGSK